MLVFLYCKKQLRYIIALLCFLFAFIYSAQEGQGAPPLSRAELMERALKASSPELAFSYHNVSRMLEQWFPLVEKGMNIVMPSGTVTKDNVQDLKNEYRKRQQVYEDAIRTRGFKNIAGDYRVENATESCSRSFSLWAAGAKDGTVKTLTIKQDSCRIVLVNDVLINGKSGKFEIKGVVVGSSFVFDEPTNSDYTFIGEIMEGNKIVVKPNVEQILSAWPGPKTGFSIPAPDRNTLTDCSVTLVQVTK